MAEEIQKCYAAMSGVTLHHRCSPIGVGRLYPHALITRTPDDYRYGGAAKVVVRSWRS